MGLVKAFELVEIVLQVNRGFGNLKQCESGLAKYIFAAD